VNGAPSLVGSSASCGFAQCTTPAAFRQPLHPSNAHAIDEVAEALAFDAIVSEEARHGVDPPGHDLAGNFAGQAMPPRRCAHRLRRGRVKSSMRALATFRILHHHARSADIADVLSHPPTRVGHRAILGSLRDTSEIRSIAACDDANDTDALGDTIERVTATWQ